MSVRCIYSLEQDVVSIIAFVSCRGAHRPEKMKEERVCDRTEQI